MDFGEGRAVRGRRRDFDELLSDGRGTRNHVTVDEKIADEVHGI
jgi:hypothetical protein